MNWITEEGQEVEITDLTNEHLYNIIEDLRLDKLFPQNEKLRQEWYKIMQEESYNRQIKALLNDDFKEFCAITQFFDDRRPIASHHAAWARTGGRKHSLFAYFPQSSWTYCASQIETDVMDDNPVCGWVRRKILENAVVSLPSPSGEYGIRFSREELEEFKRRQLVARFELPLEDCDV